MSPVEAAKKANEILLQMLTPSERKRARSLARNVFEVIDLEDAKVAYVAGQLALVRKMKKDEAKKSRRAVKR